MCASVPRPKSTDYRSWRWDRKAGGTCVIRTPFSNPADDLFRSRTSRAERLKSKEKDTLMIQTSKAFSIFWHNSDRSDVQAPCGRNCPGLSSWLSAKVTEFNCYHKFINISHCFNFNRRIHVWHPPSWKGCWPVCRSHP